jgi:signal transduction histidine kinase
MIITALLLSSLVTPAAGEDRVQATTKEAERMVHKAVALVVKEGKEKALAVFNDTKGASTYQDLNVLVLDLEGKVVAHGKNPALVGRNDIKDGKGKYGFAAQILRIGKDPGTGRLEYDMDNPVSHKVEHKVAYVERVDDLIISSGVFQAAKT